MSLQRIRGRCSGEAFVSDEIVWIGERIIEGCGPYGFILLLQMNTLCIIEWNMSLGGVSLCGICHRTEFPDVDRR